MTVQPAAPASLHIARDGAGVDVEAACQAAAAFLSALGIDVDREDLRETPASRAEFFALAGGAR